MVVNDIRMNYYNQMLLMPTNPIKSEPCALLYTPRHQSDPVTDSNEISTTHNVFINTPRRDNINDKIVSSSGNNIVSVQSIRSDGQTPVQDDINDIYDNSMGAYIILHYRNNAVIMAMIMKINVW